MKAVQEIKQGEGRRGRSDLAYQASGQAIRLISVSYISEFPPHISAA